MDSNTHSTHPPGGPVDDDLAALQAIACRLAARDLDQLPDPVRAARVLALRQLLDGLDGQWRNELAGVDHRARRLHGALPPDPPTPDPPTPDHHPDPAPEAEHRGPDLGPVPGPNYLATS
jgi:hypothetical protein